MITKMSVVRGVVRGTVYEGCIYAYCNELPYVIVFDIHSGEIIRRILCPEEGKLQGGLFSGICVDSDRVVLIPSRARNLWIYELSTDRWDKIDISRYISQESKCKFIGGSLYYGKLYMYGSDYSGIVVLDIITGEMRELLKGEDLTGGFNGVTSVFMDDRIFIPKRYENKLVCIDAKNSLYSLINLNLNDSVANEGITYDRARDCFYIIKNIGNTVYRFDRNFNKIDPLYLCDYFDTSKNYFNGIECFNDKLVLYGPHNVGYLYDLHNNNDSYLIDDLILYAKTIDDHKLFVIKNFAVEIWNEHLQIIWRKNIEFCKEEVVNELKRIKLPNEIFIESETFGLNQLVAILQAY